MPPIIALIGCAILVTVLLFSEQRRSSQQVSPALWVPTILVLIYGSRPIGRWFEQGVIFDDASASIESGSLLDRWVISILIAFALYILLRKKIDWHRIAKDNVSLILMFVYMAVSVLWSEIPFASFKRWFRATGDIVLALVVLSERMPLLALESVFRRCAYVLIPFSLVLVKYFPHLGRSYGRWSGGEMWVGVTVQKNCLGQLCALSAFLLVWSLHREWRMGTLFTSRSQAFADVLVLAMAIFLLRGPGSYSATSLSILILGITILLLLYQRKNLSRHLARHLKVYAISFTLMYVLLYDFLLDIILPVLGRDRTLTGRTEIWGPLLDFASRNSLFGTGYGGFWAPGNTELEAIFSSNFILAQAHNGYLAVYVELGIVGIMLLLLFLLAYCGKVQRMLNHRFDWGLYGLCLLPMSLLYNNTEVSFLQSPNYLWATMVLLTVVFSESSLPANSKEQNSTLPVSNR